MPPQTRKSSALNKSDVKRNKENNEDSKVFSLPVLFDEKINSTEKSQKKREEKAIEKKIPEILIPKVRLTCLPLNIEKVIDLTKNKITKDGDIKKVPVRKRKTKAAEKNSKKVQSYKPVEIKPIKGLRPRFKDEEEYRYLYNSASSNTNVGPCQKKVKIYIKESKFILRKGSVICSKNNQKQEIKSDKYTLEGKVEHSNQQTVANKIEEAQKVLMDNKINDMNFAPDVESIIDQKCELKKSEYEKSQMAREVKPQQPFAKPVVFCPEEKSFNFCSEPIDSNELRWASLQSAIDSFISNTHLGNEKDIAALKKGLCLVWMCNNFKCTNGLCPYHHNALSLFTKKLKQYPSRHIMTVLLAMKSDTLFVDVVLAAFNILSDRKAPTIWVSFLIFFVFYVTEPSDSRFFKFWASAARFFYRLSESFRAGKGFASLLSIFSHINNSEDWKIVEFIKFIKQSPVQIQTTYDLLQPVLKLNLPSQFLIEAVEHSIATETDVLEVYTLIIPKISVMTSPIPIIELLLKFCNTLESLHYKDLAVNLKRKLRKKVGTFKIKIFHRDYPLTAVFQEELLNPNSESNFAVDVCFFDVNSSSRIALRKNNYFQLDDEFYNVISQALAINSIKSSVDFNKIDDKTAENVARKEKEENDVKERQVTRVKQFFNDCQFDVLGKYLNNLKLEVVEETAQEFIKALFQMKINFQEVLDLVKIILMHCQSETAAKINASICVTLIANLVKINEWEMAHTILLLCEEKGINLIEGKVYCFNELSNITQFRVLLLIVEIYIYKENFQTALRIVKTHHLHSANTSLWRMSWKSNDEVIRVRILEEFFAQTISKHLTNVACDLFMLIWVEQNTLLKPVDLGKFINEILILLLNRNVEEGVKFFEKIRGKVPLSETATRAMVVALVGQNNLKEAKSIMQAIDQTTYTLPEVTPHGATITMSSLWLEEEIYVMIDSLFDMLVNGIKPALRRFENFEVNIDVVKPKATLSKVRPLCLGLINSTLEHACKRIERVLQNQFNPSIKLIVLPYRLLLDKPSLQLYLEHRFRRAPA